MIFYVKSGMIYQCWRCQCNLSEVSKLGFFLRVASLVVGAVLMATAAIVPVAQAAPANTAAVAQTVVAPTGVQPMADSCFRELRRPIYVSRVRVGTTVYLRQDCKRRTYAWYNFGWIELHRMKSGYKATKNGRKVTLRVNGLYAGSVTVASRVLARG
jgi:hypothetical protein